MTYPFDSARFHAKMRSAEIMRFVKRAALTDSAAEMLSDNPENYRITVLRGMAAEMVVEVERGVAAAAQSDTVVDSTYMPDTWVDHFKMHFWLRWWMPRRWVAKPKMRNVPTVLRRYNLCPHLKADPEKAHVQFLFIEQDGRKGGE